MKRISFVLAMALAATAVPVAGQQTTTSQRPPTLCRDTQGRAYSEGALTKGDDGSVLRCESGEWKPVPSGPPTTVSGQQPPQPGQRPAAYSRGREPEAANVRLEIEINDQSAGGKPATKIISMLIADRADGRVRSTGTLTQEWVDPGMVAPDGKRLVSVRPVGEVQLNVDAAVELLDGDRIRSRITLEYTPGPSEPLPAGSAATRSPLNQSVTVILQNGKPLVITQAADPLSDRKITVEVTATILR